MAIFQKKIKIISNRTYIFQNNGNPKKILSEHYRSYALYSSTNECCFDENFLLLPYLQWIVVSFLW
jgi:hypothetical protein